MYKIFVTEGIILEKRVVGESGSRVSVLTQDLGVVRATARAAQTEKSKLRYGLEPLTHGRYSFVRGKNDWRLTGVEAVSRPFMGGAPASITAAARVAKLLLRLVQGEEPHQGLFATVKEGFVLLAKAETVESVEVVLVLRVLSCLGYLPHTEALRPYVDGALTQELSVRALQEKSLLVRTINKSLEATHL